MLVLLRHLGRDGRNVQSWWNFASVERVLPFLSFLDGFFPTIFMLILRIYEGMYVFEVPVDVCLVQSFHFLSISSMWEYFFIE